MRSISGDGGEHFLKRLVLIASKPHATERCDTLRRKNNDLEFESLAFTMTAGDLDAFGTIIRTFEGFRARP